MNLGFLNFLFGGADNAASSVDVPLTVINPSTGLPMIESDMGGVDVGGSPFGMDVHSHMGDCHTDSNPWD